MARPMNLLTARTMLKKGDGLHSDGGNLFLSLKNNGRAQSWIFRYNSRTTGKLVSIGLGSCSVVTLADAREEARKLRAMFKEGRDPASERKSAASALAVPAPKQLTFGECATLYIDGRKAAWRNSKHKDQWINTLSTHASSLTNVPIDDVTVEEIRSSLDKIWKSKNVTARRVQQRIEAVINWAIALEHRKSSINPGTWKGKLDRLLPNAIPIVRHHPCIPYKDMPDFMVELRKRDCISAKALELAILSGGRASEIAKAKWEEFDLDGGMWTIPAERMKGERDHRVALCKRAVDVVSTLARHSDFVFPGNKGKPHLNPESLRKFLKIDLDRPEATTHGFRSSFRDWASEMTDHDGHVVEMAISHTIKDKVERAYRRGDLFEKRIALMADWEKYLAGKSASNHTEQQEKTNESQRI